MAGYLGSVPVPQATQHRETFTATAGQTTFNTAGYTPQFIDVYLNGVHLSPADVTATNGSDVVLAACLVNDIVDVVSYTPFEVASQTFTGNTIMTNGDNTAQLELISTDADNSAGPLLDFNRNSASPADGDVTGNIRFIGENDAGESTVFSDIINQTFDVSNGTEDGVMYIRTMEAGTLAYRITMNPTETVFNDDSLDQDFRVESNGNANMLFVDGGNNRVGIGTNTPQVGTLHVHTATAGTVTASPQADDLVVESNTETGITILSPDDQTARIRFSSPSTNTDVGGATIFYRQNINLMKVGTAVAGGVTQLVSGADVAALSCDANGAVTMPLQPAFQAIPSSGQDNFAINSNVTVAFGTERFDKNADFASSTFTAPVAGVYQFAATLYMNNIDSAADYYEIRLTTTNKTYFSIIDPGQFNGDLVYFSLNVSVLADMAANDTCFVAIRQSGGTAQTDIGVSSNFSGYLVA